MAWLGYVGTLAAGVVIGWLGARTPERHDFDDHPGEGPPLGDTWRGER